MAAPHQDPAKAGATSQASLLGLPTELRLKIYAYLAEPIHYHVDNLVPYVPAWDVGLFKNKRFCHTPDPACPFLCSKPVYSGWQPTQELCHNLPGSSSESAAQCVSAICRTCKLIYSETDGMFDSKWIGITIRHLFNARDMLKYTHASHLETIVHLTIQYLPSRYDTHSGMHPIVQHLRNHHADLPNLCTVAVQGPRAMRKFCQQEEGMMRFRPEETWFEGSWFIGALRDALRERTPIVEVGIDAWVIIRAGHLDCKSGNDEMVRIRGTIDQGSGALRCEVKRQEVVEDGPWKKFWEMWGMGYPV
ncbi:hypothetical protein EJ02DRAFT_96234 [Clathrospora elynae]|uniref:Uncharacterized protein n=1 Tax=Clathrospora elynae TaxID=706981 RepID=A0A6A5SFW5_9PLEO|nr:hypothetical protein EJ02DRAFT_96234 [Clathrospora elynae]